MKSLTMMVAVTMAWSVGVAAAKSPKPALENRVVVYLDTKDAAFAGPTMTSATLEASCLFKAAGIKLVWRAGSAKANESGRVVGIRFVESAPKEFRTREKAEVLAIAQPYGVGPLTITVFVDRVTALISPFDTRNAGRVLGHVLGHELGHVLEGVARHSNAGLMKAHWSGDDFAEMKLKSLGFDAHDVDLLRNSFGGTLVAEAGR